MQIRMRKRSLVIGMVAIVVLLLSATVAMAGGQPKRDICHFVSQGNYNLISVAEPGFEAHLAHHFDIAPSANTHPLGPDFGKTVDNNCNIVTDPCTAAVQAACAAEGNYCISGSATCIEPPDDEF